MIHQLYMVPSHEAVDVWQCWHFWNSNFFSFVFFLVFFLSHQSLTPKRPPFTQWLRQHPTAEATTPPATIRILMVHITLSPWRRPEFTKSDVLTLWRYSHQEEIQQAIPPTAGYLPRLRLWLVVRPPTWQHPSRLATLSHRECHLLAQCPTTNHHLPPHLSGSQKPWHSQVLLVYCLVSSS